MKRIFLLPLLLYSCTIDQNRLIGAWQAVSYFEMGQTVDTPLDSVRLSFTSSTDYTFTSIGYYEERGQYRLAGNYLFLRDTTVPKPREKAFKIKFLSEDSLKIGMEAEGKEQTVFLGRIK